MRHGLVAHPLVFCFFEKSHFFLLFCTFYILAASSKRNSQASFNSRNGRRSFTSFIFNALQNAFKIDSVTRSGTEIYKGQCTILSNSLQRLINTACISFALLVFVNSGLSTKPLPLVTARRHSEKYPSLSFRTFKAYL